MRQSKQKKPANKLTQIHHPKKQPLSDPFQLQPQPEWSQTQITLTLQSEQKLQSLPTVFLNFPIYLTPDGHIELKKLSVLNEDSSLSYYWKERDLYVFGTLVPKSGGFLDKGDVVDGKFVSDGMLRVKVRQRKRVAVQQLIEQQRQKYQEIQQDKNFKGQKQKKISQVVEKVALWRKFYTGFYDESGNYIQKQLDIAAQDIGIAKKTLDDYLLQIRNGKKYGFNFNQKFHCRIGQLRAFVRDQKKKQSR